MLLEVALFALGIGVVGCGLFAVPRALENARTHSDEWRAQRIIDWMGRPLPTIPPPKIEDQFKPLEGFRYPHMARGVLNDYLSGYITTEQFLDFVSKDSGEPGREYISTTRIASRRDERPTPEWHKPYSKRKKILDNWAKP